VWASDPVWAGAENLDPPFTVLYCIAELGKSCCINPQRGTVEELCKFGDIRCSESRNFTFGAQINIALFSTFSV
jgi:hypothetical protein